MDSVMQLNTTLRLMTCYQNDTTEARLRATPLLRSNSRLRPGSFKALLGLSLGRAASTINSSAISGPRHVEGICLHVRPTEKQHQRASAAAHALSRQPTAQLLQPRESTLFL